MEKYDDCKTCPHKHPDRCPCEVIETIIISDEEVELIKQYVKPTSTLN